MDGAELNRAVRAGTAVLVVGLVALLLAPALAASPVPAGLPSVAAIAARVSPAVVSIIASGSADLGSAAPPAAAPGSGERPVPEDGGSGSGFVVSADGQVVTSAHVVAGATMLLVTLADGTSFPATVLGADRRTDIALLKVEAGRPLPFVAFGDSDTLAIGDWVMAVGDPFGLTGSVTVGVVSGLDRNIDAGPYDSYVQTDAPLNPGNSGGPLFDMDGKVIGICSSIVSRGGQALGIAFAVPGNLAQAVIGQLATAGVVRRGWLGVGIQEVTEDVAASLGLPEARGVIVSGIAKGSPADGVLEEGDIVLSFDGRPVRTLRDLPRLAAASPPGKSVALDILRGGKEQALPVVLGLLQDGDGASAEATPAPHRAPLADGPRTLSDLLGMEIAPIDDARRKAFALPDGVTGLVVVSVRADGDAAGKGLTPGFVVTGVNQRQVATVADVAEIVAEAQKAGRPAVLLKVIDPLGNGKFIAVRLTE